MYATRAILAPFGQRTSLELTEQRSITTLTDPLGRKLNSLRQSARFAQPNHRPKGGVHRLVMTTRFLTACRPYSRQRGSEYKESFERVQSESGHTVAVSTPLARSTEYAVRFKAGDVLERGFRLPDQRNIEWNDTLVTRTETAADSTTTRTDFEPDPDFGAQSLLPKQTTVTTPGGRTLSAFGVRSKEGNRLALDVWSEAREINERIYDFAFVHATGL